MGENIYLYFSLQILERANWRVSLVCTGPGVCISCSVGVSSHGFKVKSENNHKLLISKIFYDFQNFP